MSWLYDDCSTVRLQIGSVMQYLPRFALCVFMFLVLTVTAVCGKDNTITDPTDPTPTRIAISPTNVSLASVGETIQLVASVYDENDEVIPTVGVTWSSNDALIATVSNAGVVTAMSVGTARITASVQSLSAEITVTVASSVADTTLVVDTESAALMSLYESTDGDNWRVQSNWMSNKPLSAWFGVTVNGEGSVVELDLSENNLAGPLPDDIGRLASLRRLVLRQNGLTGEIPSTIGQLAELRELDLSHNLLSGNIPESIGQLGYLAALFVDNNKELVGPLPRSMLKLTFRIFWTVNTQLCTPGDEAFNEWSINAIANEWGLFSCASERSTLVTFYYRTGGPDWTNNQNWLSSAPIGDWYGIETDDTGSVKSIVLEDNNLHGEIPPELAALSSLRVLLLNFNELTGPIPGELSDLDELRTIELISNSLSGSLPPELGLMSNLQDFAVYENELTGSIPPSIGQMKNVRWFSVSRNRLTGSIPPELGSMTSLSRLYLHGNELTGEIPGALGQLSELTIFELHDNRISGSIPPEFGQLAKVTSLLLSGNELSGAIPSELSGMKDLRTLWMDNNQLSGPIPPELAELHNLRVLWLYGNQLSGSIPPELGSMANLIRVSLSSNRLSGTIPEEIGDLANMEVFLVRDNMELTGSLPRSFLQLDLAALWLSGTGVCVPMGSDYSNWLATIDDFRGGVRCQLDNQHVANSSIVPSAVSWPDIDTEEGSLGGWLNDEYAGDRW